MIIIMLILTLGLSAYTSSSVKGVVVDKRTGKPIEEVKIKVFYFKRKSKKEGFYYDKTITDKDGKFEFFLEKEGYYLLMYYPPSPYAMCNSDEEFKKNLIKVERGKRIKIIRKLERGGKLVLEVKDKGTGERVDDVEVDFARFGYEYVHYHFKVRKMEKGVFINDQLYKGRYKIAIMKESYWMKVKEFEMDYGEEKRIKVYFNSKSKTGIKGRVICNGSGEGLEKVKLSVGFSEVSYFVNITTDNNGFFKIIDMPPRKYYISISGEKEAYSEDYKFYEKYVRVIENSISKVIIKVDCSYKYKD